MLIKCPKCGKSNLSSSKNCLFCNAPLDSASAQSFNQTINPSTEKVVVQQKSTFKVTLAEVGPKKLNVIKELRGITKLDLLGTTRLVESKGVIKENATKEEADYILATLTKLGARVIIE